MRDATGSTGLLIGARTVGRGNTSANPDAYHEIMATHPRRGAYAAVLAVSLAACSNYDFARARTPDGRYDMAKLMADLSESGKPSLMQGIWIPLIYANFTTFKKNEDTLPDGFTLEDVAGYGPLFCGGSTDKQIVDTHGAEIESQDHEWVGWALLYNDRDSYIQTPHGRRIEKRQRFLVLIQQDSDAYARPASR